MSISNDDAQEIIDRLKLAAFAEVGPCGPTGKSLIHLDDAELVVGDQTECGLSEPPISSPL